GADALDEALAALSVELAHDVVEEQDRRRPALLLERGALGEQERQQRQPLLALRPVDAQLDAVARQFQVPGAERPARAAAGPQPGKQRVALGEGLGVGASRAGPGRPERRDEGIEVRAAQRGRAL